MTGKEFERKFYTICQRQNIWCFRINDTYYCAKEYDPRAFVPQQACDFILHYKNNVYMTELKTTVGKSISIERDTSGMIKKHQYDQMYKRQGNNEIGIFVLQFERDTEKQSTYLITINSFMKFLEENDKKSINIKNILDYGGIKFEEIRSWLNVKDTLDKLGCPS